MILFRFCGPRNSTLLSAAIYRGPRGPVLFVWSGRRVFSWCIPAGWVPMPRKRALVAGPTTTARPFNSEV